MPAILLYAFHAGATLRIMTAEVPSASRAPIVHEVIHLGGEAAVVVPVAEYRRLRALERLAPAEVVEEAEIEATLAAHREWVAAGRPGEVSQEAAAAEMLGNP